MQEKPLIIDAHLDLSMNAMEWNRDLRKTVHEIRDLEKGLSDKPDREKGTVSFPSLLEGNIRVVVATLIARYAKPSHPSGGWQSPEQAWGMTQAQLAWYREMERHGHLIALKDSSDLEEHLHRLDEEDYQSIAYLLSLEGADSIISGEHLEVMVLKGLKAIGPAHYGPGTYAYGTDSEGSIGEKGSWLLSEMERLKVTLDATHLCDISFWEAMEQFDGTIWASHSNTRKLVNHNRQFNDDQLKALIAKDAVIGMALDAWMIVPNWKRGESTPKALEVSLEKALDHLVHICSLAGNVNHVGIGTDLDGGFGTEQGPHDVDTIADLQKLPQLLEKRGFTEKEINQVLHKNWKRKLYETLK